MEYKLLFTPSPSLTHTSEGLSAFSHLAFISPSPSFSTYNFRDTLINGDDVEMSTTPVIHLMTETTHRAPTQTRLM